MIKISFKSSTLRRLLLPLTAVALMTGYGAPASATAMFNFEASLILSLDSVSGLDIFATSFLDDDGTPFVDTFGTGILTGTSATATADNTLIDVGDSVAVGNSGSGSATLPDGFVDILSNPIIDILFENRGTNTQSVMFTLAWNLQTAASTIEPFPLEIAYANISALAVLDEASGVTDILDELSSFDGLDGPANNAGSLSFDVSIAAGDYAILSLDLFSEGYADALVPEPSTVPLLVFGLFGVAYTRRRKTLRAHK
jgi:hypothetical protein